MPEKTVQNYRAYHQRRLAEKHAKLEKKRLRILENLDQAAAVLAQRGARRVWVYGSILQPQRYHEDSDLDIICEGLPLSEWLPVLHELEKIKVLAEVEIDLKRTEELSSEFLSFAKEHGKLIAAVSVN